MNYRHAYHAGNFADVFKHIILTRVLTYQIRKPAPVRFIDTHAGIGTYDLAGEEAVRTGEWRDGIGKLDAAAVPAGLTELLAPYRDAVGPPNPPNGPRRYPGSPALAQWLLRPIDRLSLCELHPADAATLKRDLGRDKRVKVLETDGYAGLKSLVPPAERRGLVLIDPPFESPDEFERMAAAAIGATRIWATGIYLLWYPLKDRAAVARFAETLVASGLKRILQLHVAVAEAGAGPLAGAGLVIVNPPFTLEGEAERLLPWLAATLGRSGPGSWSSRWLARE